MISSQYIKKRKLPDRPGVYFFMARDNKVLYVGRATSLRDRIRNYLTQDLLETRGPKIVSMVEKARKVSFRSTDSVLEAILLEADLINKLKPPYNTDAKDDKSWNMVAITDENFPRVFVVRQRDLNSKLTARSLQLKAIFGPFTEGSKLKEILKFIRRVFPFRDNRCKPLSGKSCFNAQIGLCPGVCTGEISKTDYAENIKNIEMLFQGKKKKILVKLEKEMKNYAQAGEFERAARQRDAVRALKSINDVALISDDRGFSAHGKRIEGFDVAHTGGDSTVGVMAVIYGGVPDKAGYRKFILKGSHGGDDISALRELLERRFRHEEWGFPDLVVIDGGIAQKRVAEKVVAMVDEAHRPSVVSVVKDERHRPKSILGDDKIKAEYEDDILLADAEAHRFAIFFHRKKMRKKGFGF